MNIEQRFCTKYCAKMFGCLGLIFVIFISLVGISLGVHLLESHLPRIIELLGFLREYLSSNIFFSCYFSPPSGTLLMRPGGLLDGVLQASESLCTFFPVSAPNTGLPVLTYPPVLQAQISPWAPLVKFPFMLLYFSIPDFFIWFYLWFISLCQYSLFGETCFILFYYNLLDILSFTSLKIFVIAYWKLSSTLSGEYSIDCFPTQHPPPRHVYMVHFPVLCMSYMFLLLKVNWFDNTLYQLWFRILPPGSFVFGRHLVCCFVLLLGWFCSFCVAFSLLLLSLLLDFFLACLIFKSGFY